MYGHYPEAPSPQCPSGAGLLEARVDSLKSLPTEETGEDGDITRGRDLPIWRFSMLSIALPLTKAESK
jgi:hypothetical protein